MRMIIYELSIPHSSVGMDATQTKINPIHIHGATLVARFNQFERF